MIEYVYTANDEYPDCNRCDNINASYEFCMLCGSNNGWDGYERTVYEEEQED